MKSGIIFLWVYMCLFLGTEAQKVVKVYPTPQEMNLKGGDVLLPAVYRLVGEESFVSGMQALLKGKPDKSADFQVCVGQKGDKAVRKYTRMIPDRPEGYYLLVEGKRLVLAGADKRGVYYGMQTLAQLLKEGCLPEVVIKDYPSVRFRGVVEGFYGTPWSHEARLRQLDFYGAHKLNTYIYGPKDDPFHSCPDWRKPYPAEKAVQIRELVKEAAAHEVDFVWAIHPGQDIQWNKEDRDLLLGKFEKMYELGVRTFAVFFDDISGEGTNPERQAELLNAIDEYFVKVKKDVKPLIVCPTEYNKSWSNPARGYLTTLGEKLNPSIQVMWTGDRVISDITVQGLEWVNEKIKRPAYIWWNFPVSDYVRDHLLMGAVYGLDTHIGKEMSGFVSNPMEYAEASKTAIFSVADYAWNPVAFDSDASWKAAVKEILPGDAAALQVFVNHNSDTGPNGHGYRRDESVEVQPLLKRFLGDYRKGQLQEEDYSALMEEFAKMIEAADLLSVNQENKYLIEEIYPWLEQFKTLGLTGMEVLSMLKAAEMGNKDLFMRKYKHVKALQQRRFLIDQTYNPNPYQPGVKTGSKVMQPFVDTLFVYVTQQFNQQNAGGLDYKVYTSPHQSYSTVEQCRNLPVRVKARQVLVSPVLEVIKWGKGEYLGVELDKVYALKNLEADFGVKNSVEWLKLEVSVDGIEWKELPFNQDGNRIQAVLNTEGRYVRIVNRSDKEQEAHLKKMAVRIE